MLSNAQSVNSACIMCQSFSLEPISSPKQRGFIHPIGVSLEMDCANLDRAVSAIKKVFDAEENDFRDCFDNYVAKEFDIMEALVKECKGFKDESLGLVCNKLLDYETRKEDHAQPADVFECLVKFSAAVTLGNKDEFSQRLVASKAMNYHNYYDKFVHPAVSLTWNLVAMASPTTNLRNSKGGLSMIVGSILMGIEDFNGNKGKKGIPPMIVRSYGELKEVLIAFYDFLTSTTDCKGRRTDAASSKKARAFCNSDQYNKIIERYHNNAAEAESQDEITNVMLDADPHEEKPTISHPSQNGGRARRKSRVRRKAPATHSKGDICKPESMQRTEHEVVSERKVHHQMKQFHCDFKNAYGPTTIKLLLEELKTARFHQDGKMTLDEADLVKFWNSPFVAALFHYKINR